MSNDNLAFNKSNFYRKFRRSIARWSLALLVCLTFPLIGAAADLHDARALAKATKSQIKHQKLALVSSRVELTKANTALGNTKKNRAAQRDANSEFGNSKRYQSLIAVTRRIAGLEAENNSLSRQIGARKKQQRKQSAKAARVPQASTSQPSDQSSATCLEWKYLPSSAKMTQANAYVDVVEQSLGMTVDSYELAVAITTACAETPSQPLTDVVMVAALILAE